MSDIYNRLCYLDRSGKYYEYYPEHLANMDCFHNLKVILQKNGTLEKYYSLFMKYFKTEITEILNTKNRKLLPTANPHVFFHLRIFPTCFKAACRVLSYKSARLFYSTLKYLGQNISCYNVTKINIPLLGGNIYRKLCSKKLSVESPMHLFNALEVLDRKDQVSFLVAYVNRDLRLYPDIPVSSFGAMILQPTNLSHGEIVLMARAALECYNSKAIMDCKICFRGIDQTTESDFRMNV